MQPQLLQGRFIHIVAAVDLGNSTGAFLHVNPASVALSTTPPNERGVELHFNDAAGHLLHAHVPQLLLEACDAGEASQTGLINEAVVYIPNMQEVLLLIQGAVVAQYIAGEAFLPAEEGFMVAEESPERPHRRALTGPEDAEQPGITYTVQARPHGEAGWQTIAVGRPKPDIDVNVNQFPAATKLDVRVLMTNGFEDRVVAQQEIEVGN